MPIQSADIFIDLLYDAIRMKKGQCTFCEQRRSRSVCASVQTDVSILCSATNTTVASNSVSGQRRPRSACAFAQADQGRRCPQIAQGPFLWVAHQIGMACLPVKPNMHLVSSQTEIEPWHCFDGRYCRGSVKEEFPNNTSCADRREWINSVDLARKGLHRLSFRLH